MAEKVQRVIIDDLDGSEADQTVTFGLDGVVYQIDLTDEHAESLRSHLTEFVDKARRVGGRKMAAKRIAEIDGESASIIRQWARENGMDVPDRGRVSREIVQAYHNAVAAH